MSLILLLIFIFIFMFLSICISLFFIYSAALLFEESLNLTNVKFLFVCNAHAKICVCDTKDHK